MIWDIISTYWIKHSGHFAIFSHYTCQKGGADQGSDHWLMACNREVVNQWASSFTVRAAIFGFKTQSCCCQKTLILTLQNEFSQMALWWLYPSFIPSMFKFRILHEYWYYYILLIIYNVVNMINHQQLWQVTATRQVNLLHHVSFLKLSNSILLSPLWSINLLAHLLQAS